MRDEEGVITSLGILGELVDENSAYFDDVLNYHVDDSLLESYTHEQLEVGEYVTVQFDYGGSVGVYDLYRVS